MPGCNSAGDLPEVPGKSGGIVPARAAGVLRDLRVPGGEKEKGRGRRGFPP